MKKVYVTPVMECEEFVANEYVAACYVVTCDTWTGHDKILGKGCKGHSEIVSNPELVTDPEFAFQSGTWWNGTINGQSTWHHVKSELVTPDNYSDYDNHPNASV